jgi:hypothetical protein
MCIMEARPDQHHSTIAQACAHNLSTIDRDCDMWRKLAVAQGDTDALNDIDQAQADIHSAYVRLLNRWGTEVAKEYAHGHAHTGQTGSERVYKHVDRPFVDAVPDAEKPLAASAVRGAERYETR